MYETNNAKWEASVFAQGIKKGISWANHTLVTKLIENNFNSSLICSITKLSPSTISRYRGKDVNFHKTPHLLLPKRIQRKKQVKIIQTKKDIEDALHILASKVNHLKKSLLNRGIDQGIEQRTIEIVEKMLENNISNTDIHKITGLSLAKIDQIRKKLKKK